MKHRHRVFVFIFCAEIYCITIARKSVESLQRSDKNTNNLQLYIRFPLISPLQDNAQASPPVGMWISKPRIFINVSARICAHKTTTDVICEYENVPRGPMSRLGCLRCAVNHSVPLHNHTLTSSSYCKSVNAGTW